MHEPTGPADGPGLTTGALARKLGVSPTTLRSWDRRYGLGPAVRAEGRHRRWSPADVAVLEEMCRLTSSGVPPAEAARLARRRTRPGAARIARQRTGPAGRRADERAADRAPWRLQPQAAAGAGDRETQAGTEPGPPSPAEARREARGLSRAAVRLDAPAVAEQLEAAVARYGLAGAWQDVMVPTLHAVGRRWAESGDRYVEVEHLLSWQVSTTLRRHTRPPARPGDAPADAPVVLACVPGEEHTLPIEALNAALSERGVATRMFGAAVPPEALTAAVRRLGPSAVVLWAQARSMASPPLARYVAGSRWGVTGARRRPLVLLGGPGWAGRPTAGTARPASLDEALGLLTGAPA